MAARRRGEELEAEILEAAWAEILEHGYLKLTIEGVAARVHTGKQVLYRRWPNRVHLAVAAIRHNLGSLITAAPDTGSLREDYLTVLRLMAKRAEHYTPELLHGLLSEMPGLHDFFSTLPGVLTEILDNAVARGELSHAHLPDRVVNLPLDLLRYEGLRSVRDWSSIAEVDLEKLFAEILDDVFLPLVRALAGPPGRG